MRKSFISVLSILILLVSCDTKKIEKVVVVPNKKSEVVHNENTEWANTWIVNTNDSLKTKVLVIGDSHVERYYGIVSNNLGDDYSCSKFTTSKSLGDKFFIEQLRLIMNQYDFDIITINNGLHGDKYDLDSYTSYLPIVQDLIKQDPENQILWVNTTAIREPNNITSYGARNSQILERNSSLKSFAESRNLALVDFYSVTADSVQFYSNDGIHFNKLGVEKQANIITDKILAIKR